MTPLTPLSPIARLGYLALFAFGLLLMAYAFTHPAQAATPGATSALMTCGKVEVLTTATEIPVTSPTSRNSLVIQNLGPNAIYCGATNAVTTLTGIKIAALGGTFPIDVTWDAVNARPRIYCVAKTASQVAGDDTNTRYCVVR